MADADSSIWDTGSVASGDDVNGSVSNSFLSPLSDMNDQLTAGLLHQDSDSSDIEDTNDENKEGC